MKKAIRNLVIGATCATMLLAVTGCQNTSVYDTETRPVALAIGALDKNFNPFFYTSGNDGEVIGKTQISMLTADANGNIVCGNDQETMALDYSITQYASQDDSQEWTSGTVNHTTYKFVIKKGVKDSMGYDMDIRDVLFNLYVYLDPVYTGSTTIYSTDIRGLKSYRAQQHLPDDSDLDIEEEYRGEALDRIEAIRDYDKGSQGNGTSFDTVKNDIQALAKIFKEGLESDWNSVVGTLNSYEEYNFTKDWEVFLFNEGLVGYQYKYNANNNLERIKVDGKYLTVLDPAHPDARPFDADIVNAMNDATSNGTSEKDAAMDIVFSKYLYEITSGENKGLYDGNVTGALSELLASSYGNELMQQFIREAMSNENGGSSSLVVNSVSGIKTEKATTFNGKNLGSEHDVLSITINGVDPAAIYNFAFTVAPMHYYSGVGDDGIDYVARCNEHWNDSTYDNRFGVRFSNDAFMQNVIGAASKTEAPVGAGAYKMREGAVFFNNSIVEYERNTNFTTLGDGIDNAKIKYLRYVYTTDDQIINSLINEVVDYGTPNCTPKNIEAITDISHLNNKNYDANGFGYVGINPTFVPDREVRLAIMLAMNPSVAIIKNYYTEQYSSEIYRPTSKTNFLNTNDKTGALRTPYVSGFEELMPNSKTSGIRYGYQTDTSVIESLVESAGYTKTDGKYYKNGKMLTLTFTIAGETADHPAYGMFVDAADDLNKIGFDITVKNDRNALIKLATGKLEVWAAAWTTGIDPDLYQIYHKDSKATSTKNWGYETIMNNQSEYAEENALLTYLSAEIDLARSNVNEEFRTVHYVNALNAIMELAVELPTYQRHDLAVYNNKVIKIDSINQNPSANAGLLFKIWELDYN